MNTQERFIEKYRDCEFRHKDELFARLRADECIIKGTPEDHGRWESCRHFLSIYRIRAEHLRQFDTPHAQRLREDALALCEELAKTPDEVCRLWRFSLPPHSFYIVFEGAESGRILGCILGADKLLMPPDEWERLWHGESKSV